MKMKTCKLLIVLLLMTFNVDLTYAQYQPTVFKPVEYKPQSIDYSKLERSFKKQEERKNKAYEQYSELMQLIGAKRQQISNDRESLIWFEESINSMTKTVESSLNVGDYSTAYNIATRFIGNIYSHTELNCRIRTYEEYVSVVKSIQDRTDLNYQQKQEWLEMNVYKFVPICNDEGKIIGAYNWMDVGGPGNTRVVLP